MKKFLIAIVFIITVIRVNAGEIVGTYEQYRQKGDANWRFIWHSVLYILPDGHWKADGPSRESGTWSVDPQKPGAYLVSFSKDTQLSNDLRRSAIIDKNGDLIILEGPKTAPDALWKRVKGKVNVPLKGDVSIRGQWDAKDDFGTGDQYMLTVAADGSYVKHYVKDSSYKSDEKGTVRISGDTAVVAKQDDPNNPTHYRVLKNRNAMILVGLVPPHYTSMGTGYTLLTPHSK